MTNERDFRFDMAAKLVTELQDRYRLPGETWDIVFDPDAEGYLAAMTEEDAFKRIRAMVEDEDEREGIVSFLKETAMGFITDGNAEEDWRVARAALTLLCGRDGEDQAANPHNVGVRGVGGAFEAYKRTGGWRGLNAEAAIETFVHFCEHELPHEHTVLRRVGKDALVFTREDSPEPYVVARGYDEWRGEWRRGTCHANPVEAWLEIDPDAIEGTSVWWSRSDFVQAFDKAGLDMDDDLLDEAIERTFDMQGWKDLAIAHGWECIDGVVFDVKNGRTAG